MKHKNLVTALISIGFITSTHANAQNSEEKIIGAQQTKNEIDSKVENRVDKKADNKATQTVLVTGSSIKRIGIETASPLQVITKEQIVASGANSLQKVLEKLTSSMPALVDKSSLFGSSPGASQANMRGLGAHATLMLLNGRRLSSYGATDGGQFQFVNIDALPSAAIERIEVLQDGASAIYGSDAIAGVINVITKSSYQGFEIKGGAQESLRSHSHKENNASLSFGYGDLVKDNYNVFGTLSLYQRKPVAVDETFALLSARYKKEHPDWFTKFHTADGSPPGEINPGGFFVYDDQGASFRMASPACKIPVTRSNGTTCEINSLKNGQNVVPSSDRANLFVSGKWQLNADWQLFSELSYTKIDFLSNLGSAYRFSSGNDYQWYARNTGFELQKINYPYLGPNNSYNQLSAELKTKMGGIAGLNYTYLDEPLRSIEHNTDQQFRLVGGVVGNIAKWDVESAVTFAGTRSVSMSSGNNESVKGFEAAFGPYTIDSNTGLVLMNDHPKYQFGVTNASNLALLRNMFPVNHTVRTDRIATWDGKATRSLFALPGGEMQVAVGFNLMHETFSDPGNPVAATGDIVWQGGSWAQGSRTTQAVYAEALMPISKSLEVNIAGRLDKYPGFALHAVPKVGLKYDATKNLILRGTYSHGFRAPSLAESGSGGIYAMDFVDDVLRCSQTDAMAELLSKSKSPNDVQSGKEIRGSDCSAKIIGSVTTPNPSLQPETAKISTIGFVFSPSNMFDLSADYFVIARKNEIVKLGFSDVLQRETEKYGPALIGSPNAVRNPISLEDKSRVARVIAMCANPINAGICPNVLPAYTVGTMGGAIGGYENRSQTHVSGFDLSANSHFKFARFGKIDIGAQTTIYRDYSYPDPGKLSENRVGRYGYPRNRTSLYTNWSIDKVHLGLTGNYVSRRNIMDKSDDRDWSFEGCKEREIANPEECKKPIASSIYWTLNLGWDATKNLNINMNIQNVFNRIPPHDIKSWNNNVSEYESDLGRIISLSASYTF